MRTEVPSILNTHPFNLIRIIFKSLKNRKTHDGIRPICAQIPRLKIKICFTNKILPQKLRSLPEIRERKALVGNRGRGWKLVKRLGPEVSSLFQFEFRLVNILNQIKLLVRGTIRMGEEVAVWAEAWTDDATPDVSLSQCLATDARLGAWLLPPLATSLDPVDPQGEGRGEEALSLALSAFVRQSCIGAGGACAALFLLAGSESAREWCGPLSSEKLNDSNGVLGSHRIWKMWIAGLLGVLSQSEQVAKDLVVTSLQLLPESGTFDTGH